MLEAQTKRHCWETDRQISEEEGDAFPSGNSDTIMKQYAAKEEEVQKNENIVEVISLLRKCEYALCYFAWAKK